MCMHRDEELKWGSTNTNNTVSTVNDPKQLKLTCNSQTSNCTNQLGLTNNGKHLSQYWLQDTEYVREHRNSRVWLARWDKARCVANSLIKCGYTCQKWTLYLCSHQMWNMVGTRLVVTWKRLGLLTSHGIEGRIFLRLNLYQHVACNNKLYYIISSHYQLDSKL